MPEKKRETGNKKKVSRGRTNKTEIMGRNANEIQGNKENAEEKAFAGFREYA